MIISGYIPFDQASNYYFDDQGKYRIILDSDCLKRADLSKCYCCLYHNTNPVETLIDAQYLTLKITTYGLFYQGEIRDYLNYRKIMIQADIKSRLLRGSSLSYYFIPFRQEWITRDGERIQIIKEITTLEHVSPVIDPAYPRSWVKIGSFNEPIQIAQVHEKQD